MHPSAKRKFGRVDLEVTSFAFGTAPVGNIFREIDEATSDAMFQRSWEAGVRYYDTAPMYGHGLSELRTGQSLRWKRRDDFVLSTKVGRLLRPARRDTIDFAPWTNAAPFTMAFDYSYDGTMRSVEDSLQRLALESIDILFIHDIDVFTRGKDQPEVFREAMDGCWKALEKLRAEKGRQGHRRRRERMGGLPRGAEAARLRLLPAGGPLHPARTGRAGRLPAALRGARRGCGRGRRLQLGDPRHGRKARREVQLRPRPQPILDKVTRIEAVCRAHGVPLPAAALQFVVAHPAIPSFIAGTRTVEQLEQNLAWFSHPIPASFWSDLKAQGLLREDAPTP